MANPHQISPVLFCDSLKGFFASGLTWITSWIILNYNKRNYLELIPDPTPPPPEVTSACDAFMVGSFKWQSVPWVWKWREKLKSTTLYHIHTLHYTSTAGSSWLSLQRTVNQSCHYSESRYAHFWRRLTPASLVILNLSLLGAECVWRAAIRLSRLYSRI